MHGANMKITNYVFITFYYDNPDDHTPKSPQNPELHLFKNVRSRTDTNKRRIEIIVNLLTPRSKVLLEKLTASQVVKKFLTFYGTRKFITAFTCAHHLSLSLDRSVQSMPTHPNSCTPILILSSHLRLCLPRGLFPSDFTTNTLYAPLLSPYVLHAPPILFFSI